MTAEWLRREKVAAAVIDIRRVLSVRCDDSELFMRRGSKRKMNKRKEIRNIEDDEQWKEIKGFPGYYISTKGRVKSIKCHREKMLKIIMHRDRFYVSLWQDNRCYHKQIHRLIAEAFIPNPFNFPVVRHLNDNPLDNRIDNLAWGTQQDNLRDAIKNGSLKPYGRQIIPVKAKNLITGEITYYDSMTDAACALEIDMSSVRDVIFGYSNKRDIYTFARLGDEFKDVDPNMNRRRIAIKAQNLMTGEIQTFYGPTEASKALNIAVSHISSCLKGNRKTAGGYTFEYT